MIHDGQSLWFYNLRLNEYVEETEAPESRRGASPGLHAFADIDSRYFSRFRTLGQFRKTARFVRSETIKTAVGARAVAIVIEIRSLEGSEYAWNELLWVDPETFLLLRVSVSPGNQPWHRTTSFEYKALNEAPPAYLFEFAPPPKARRVEKFSRKQMVEPAPLPY